MPPSGRFRAAQCAAPTSGGILWGGRGRTPAPTVGNGPGVLVRQTQAQVWNRTSGNFCKPRAQWPGLNSEKPLHFCAPEIFCPPQGVTPAFGVRGKATMSTKCSSGAVPGGVLPSFSPWKKKVAARRRRNIPRTTNAIRTLPPHPAPSGPPSPQGEGFVGEGPSSPQGDGRIKERPAKSPQKNLHLSPRNFPQAVIQCLLKKYW